MKPRRGWLAFAGGYGAAGSVGLHAIEVGPGPRLRLLRSFAGVDHPSYLVASPDGALFVASEVEQGAVHRFVVRDMGLDVDLEPDGRVGTGGSHPCHLALHPSGRWLAAANYGSGDVALIEVGGPMRQTALDQHTGAGPVPGRQDGPHAHAGCFSPDGHHLVTADLGTDEVTVNRIDLETGGLTRVVTMEAHPGAGPRHLLFMGPVLVVVNELSNTVSSYRWDPAGPTLAVIDERSTLPSGSDAGLAAALRAAPSGRHVYVSNRGPDSVSVIGVGDDGTFGSLEAVPAGGAWPREVAVTPDGRGLLVTNERDALVTWLPIAGDGASLGPVAADLELPAPTSIAFA